jgi:hypothetical protein
MSKELNLHKISYDYINPYSTMQSKLTKFSKMKTPGIEEIMRRKNLKDTLSRIKDRYIDD